MVIIGAAYLARYGLRLGRLLSAGVVAAAYLVLGAFVLLWFGWTPPGRLGLAGMLVPLLAGWGLTIFGPKPR